MTDRELLELLELAAKAGGVELGYWCPNNGAFWCGEYWNPDTDDGDALRLAVKLSIRIYPPEPHLYNQNADKASTNVFGKFWKDDNDPDPYAATRRAIVLAAAEIGKGMK